MTIRVKIGPNARDIKEADSSWINDQINCLRKQGTPICVQVFVERDSVTLRLATCGCPSAMGGSRSLTAQEMEVVALWRKLHLDSDTFTGGNLIAFLRQIA